MQFHYFVVIEYKTQQYKIYVLPKRKWSHINPFSLIFHSFYFVSFVNFFFPKIPVNDLDLNICLNMLLFNYKIQLINNIFMLKLHYLLRYINKIVEKITAYYVCSKSLKLM